MLACWLLAVAGVLPAWGQSNPSPLNLPVSQNWGTTSFTSMPAGFAAWNQLSGSAITTQALAEASSPGGNAVVHGSAPHSNGTGGCYGYAVGGDARFAILTSGNAENGVNQLGMAINTIGQSNISLSYDLINVVANARTVGVVCQYRLGSAGPWTTLAGTGNPYVQSGGTAGSVTPASVSLPAAAENQPYVQIRWAVWRGSEGGSSSGFAVDNISVTAGAPSPPAITSVDLSGSAFLQGDPANVTVQLDSAPPPGSPATLSVASGAFASGPVSITITSPNVSGSAGVTMSNVGTWTATATPITGCTGSAVSAPFTVSDAYSPTAYAGPDRTVTLNGGPLVLLMTDATASDPQGPIGLTYAWTPATAPGISGWTARTGSVIDVTSPSEAAVTINATGTYVFTLTVTDPTARTNTSNVTINVVQASPPGQYDPPAWYYDPARPGGVWYTGATLKNSLRAIISSYRGRSYDAAKQALQILDRDPDNANSLILIYTGVSVPSVWDGGETWNREHQWPDSLLGSANTGDLFNLRPSNPVINSTRGNKPYGTGSGYWDPDHGAPHRGQCARAMFYMATCYANLTLVNGLPGPGQMGDLAKLLEWHYAYPVDNFERRRNHLVWSSAENPGYYQGNRNPYVDHPELVWTVFGTGPSDAKLYLGSTVPPGGASSTTVSFQVIRGAPPPVQTVTLNKTGAAPTTYEVLVSGSAVTPAAGARQSFAGGDQARGINVSISSTAAAGNLTGSITIDNTEVSSAGAGRGSADGNDTITLTAAVLEHANASFSSEADQNALVIDLGNVPAGGTATRAFSIYNLEPLAGLTAGLGLDAISGSGHTSLLTTNLSPFTNLAAGTGRDCTATLHPTSVGSYQAMYTLYVSDQDLPGAQPGTSLSLTLRVNVVPPFPGDFNLDGRIDLADLAVFTACQTGPETPYDPSAIPGECGLTPDDENRIAADFNRDGDIDQEDFGIFQRCYSGDEPPADPNCAD